MEKAGEKLGEFLNKKSNDINKVAELYPEVKSLLINYEEIEKFDHGLAEELIANPDDTLEILQNLLKEKISVAPELMDDLRINVRFYNIPKEKGYTILVRELRAKNVGGMMAIEGLVNKITDIFPKIETGRFYCNKCNESHDEPQATRFLQQPPFCNNCKRREFRFVPEESKLTDIQKLEIQEPLELLKGGAEARRIEIWVEDDLTDAVYAGDRVVVTGIMRLLPPKKGGSVYLKYIEGNNIEGIAREFEDIEISKKEEREIKKLAKDPKIHDNVIASIAPGIWGYNEVKEAIALQLFGGRGRKRLPDGTPLRPDIHLLLVGDPGVAKSRILQYVNQIAPKSIYVTGKGTTGAGLTATAEKDDFGEGGWTLKAGALVLAGGGVVCIDEFDKMDKEDRSAMHEAMEQQSLAPNFELTLPNGEKSKIGPLVDGLMENSANVIKGIDCEILPLNGELKLLTTDFDKISEVNVDRVSRHIAPAYLIELLLQNGRTVKVTPEHPCWVIRNGNLTTIPAEEVKEGEFFPIPEELPIQGETQFFHFKSERPYNKEIKTPIHNSPEFCRFLGYHLSDGSYELNRGRKNGINFWNSNPLLMDDYITLTKNIFGVNPYVQKREKRKAARITSMQLVDFLQGIDPSLLMKGKKKRIPPTIMKCKKEDISQLLRAMFDGDGGVLLSPRNGARVRLTTENHEMAEQVQELLCRFGIRATVFEESKNIYRVDITSQGNLNLFYQKIGFLSPKKQARLERYLKIEKTHRSQVDLVPDVKDRVLDMAISLKISLKNEFGHSHERITKNMQKKNLREYVRLFESRLREIKQTLKSMKDGHSGTELINIRQKFRIPRTEIAREVGVSRETIRNWENSKIKSIEGYRLALITLLTRMSETKESVNHLRKLAFGKVAWCSVKKAKKIKNKDIKWVYDVTVEPTHTFISNNMVLHNTISVAKAGMVTRFIANTAVLAASNPKFSRFDSYKPLGEQFDIPPTLLSRFDLIFPIRDILDKEKDAEIADHMLKMHKTPEEAQEVQPVINAELFRKYIAYSRKNIRPVMTDDAADKIKAYYVDLRGGSQETVRATPRQLEALVRLAEASARIRLSDTVTVSDADRAIRLTNFVLREVAYDAATGEIDIDRIGAEYPKSDRDKIKLIEDIIRGLLAESGDGSAHMDDVLREAEGKEIDKFKAEKIINELKNKGIIYEPRHGRFMFTEH